jgi:hypothetical protein
VAAAAASCPPRQLLHEAACASDLSRLSHEVDACVPERISRSVVGFVATTSVILPCIHEVPDLNLWATILRGSSQPLQACPDMVRKVRLPALLSMIRYDAMIGRHIARLADSRSAHILRVFVAAVVR